MSDRIEVQDIRGDWVFITPIGNLRLTEAVNGEFRIDRVLFVDKKKLPRIRRRLGLAEPISKMKKFSSRSKFFESSETFAVVKHKGKPAEIKTKCFRIVRDEISILTVSQLGYSKRRFAGHVGLLGEHKPGSASHLFVDKHNQGKILSYGLTRSPGSLVLNWTWVKYQRKVLFFKLLQILGRKIPVSPSWRKDLRKAAILIGQSLNSNDISASFLWNMIAIELLLARREDKYSENLPKRVEAFLGWFSPTFKEIITEAYGKRSALVHNGDRDKITKEDLLYTDDLILNILMNIVSFPKRFGSKEQIVEFAEKVEAEQKLGLKSKVRPKLQVMLPQYSKEDFDEI